MRDLTMLEAIREALEQEMVADERVMIFGQDVGKMGGVFRVTEGLHARFGDSRVRDMPLAEGAIVGAALGLAIAGMIPVAEIQFLGFAHQAFHQIGPQLARIRYRSGGRLHAPVTIRAPFGGLARTPEHHSDALEGQFAQFPGLKVVAPSNAADAKGLLLSSIRDPNPVLFCEPIRGYRLVHGPVDEDATTVPLGQSRIARPGNDVTIVSWSASVVQCEQAAQELADEGISAEVLDLRTLVPLDVATLANAVARTGRAVVVHEASLTAGFGAEVVATIQEEVFYDLQAPIQRVASWDTPPPPLASEKLYFPSVARIVQAVKRTLQD